MAKWRPDRTVRLLAGTPPGGGQDRAARALAAALDEVLDVAIEVTNVPGRGGADAWEALATRAGDDHALAISSPTLVTNPMTGVAAIGEDDLTVLGMLCTEYLVFGVSAESELDDRAALLAALGTATPPITALATARGNVNHIALARLGRHVGTPGRDLPVRVFDSARHAIADVLAGASTLVVVSAASVIPEVSAGSLRPLAVTSPVALEAPLDAVATWQDAGVECTIGTWRGVVGAPGMTAAAAAFWDGALAAAVDTLSWKDALAAHVWADTYLDAAATRAFHADERAVLREALADLGLVT